VTALFSLLVAVDPLGLARTWPKRLEVAGIVAVVLALAASLAGTVLDALDLSPEGFWIAAGIVLLIPAISRLGQGLTRDVAGPAAVLVTMALATRDGVGPTMVAVAVTSAVTLLLTTLVDTSGRWVATAERVIGAAMVVVALDLIRDGVIAV